jgi:hypothetical protein
MSLIPLVLGKKFVVPPFVVAVSSYGRSQLYRLVERTYWPKVQVVHCGLDRKFSTTYRSKQFRRGGSSA